jgi:hypothetical protein
MAAAVKIVTHATATTVPAEIAQKTETVTVTNPVNSASGRVWVSTNPLVGVYPWLGIPVTPGNSVSIGITAGQTVYTRSGEPTSLTVTTQ